MDLLVAKEGLPTAITDLSVDEFTAARLRKTDHAGVLTIWQKPNGADFHPALLQQIGASLEGRDPSVASGEGVMRILMNVADGSFQTRLEVGLYVLRLSILIGGLPRVVVGRYRHLPDEGSWVYK